MAVRHFESALRAVEFRLPGDLVPRARRISLVAAFNGWDPGTNEMHRGPDGDWTVVVRLPPGVYPYLFLVDATWWNDPCDDGRVPSGWGNEYSLKVVR